MSDRCLIAWCLVKQKKTGDGRFFEGHALAFRAVVTHSIISAGACTCRLTKCWSRACVCCSIFTVSTANSCPLDHRTTASDTSMRCSFGRVTVSERGSPGRMGKSPEGRYPVHERFRTVPCPWNGPALYVTDIAQGSVGRDELRRAWKPRREAYSRVEWNAWQGASSE